MVDTARLVPYLLASEFQDGQAPSTITPQYVRDLFLSVARHELPTPVLVVNASTAF